MAVSVADFAWRTINGWFSGLFRKLGDKCSVGDPGYVPVLCQVAEDYFNFIDRELPKKTDLYLEQSFEAMRREFGGELPCVFLELLASAVVQIAARIALEDEMLVAARKKKREELLAAGYVLFVRHWAVEKEEFEKKVRACQQHCGRRATSSAGCCGVLQPGATQRFHFKVEAKTADDKANKVSTQLHFPAPLPEQEEEVSLVCSSCHKPNASKRCGKCRRVRYCDETCQRADWHIHRRYCSV